MDTAGYIALSRQVGQFNHMAVIAENVANVDTAGFKGQQMLFNEYVMARVGDDPASFTSDVATHTKHEQGGIRVTGRPLDAAISGEGFFHVNTPLGERFTRVGMFQINSEGTLTTVDGYEVLDDAGQPILLSENDREIVIGENGAISALVNGAKEERGVIGVVKFERQQALKHLANGLFDAEGQAHQPAEPVTDFRMVQSAVESSNVNAVEEMTRMITVNRSVGSTSKFLSETHELQRRMLNVFSKQQ